MERLRHCVKLHDRLRSAIDLQGEDQGQKWKTDVLAALEVEIGLQKRGRGKYSGSANRHTL
jgi:hypothetical protein